MKKFIIYIGIFILLWGVNMPYVIAQTYSDTTWERLYYHPNIDERTYSNNHLETYDKGYLLSTYMVQNGEYKPKLYKTDVNGYYLWDRILDTNQFVGILAMTEDNDGNIYICGSSFPEDIPNPIVKKLNTCGEVVWCKSFLWDEGSYARDIEID